MAVAARFKYAPGDIVDVPHLCMDKALVKYAILTQGGVRGYVLQSVSMGKPYEVEVFEDNVCLPRDD